MSAHTATSDATSETAPRGCRCPGCIQREDEIVGALIECHAQDKAALVRLGFDDAEARARIEARMKEGFKKSDAKVAEANPDMTSDDRLYAHEVFSRAQKRALDVLYPPA